jgi:hypothetical protein
VERKKHAKNLGFSNGWDPKFGETWKFRKKIGNFREFRKIEFFMPLIPGSVFL